MYGVPCFPLYTSITVLAKDQLTTWPWARFCARRQLTSSHGKMARFFRSMAGRAAGMRMALFTNGPGIGTLASAGLGCVALQLNFGTHALAQSRTEPKELKTKFSYEGWKQDAEIAEERDITYPEHPICAWAILDTMLRKQQVHDGDRSHPFIRKLDALTPTLSYAGWEADARKLEWPETTSRDSVYTLSSRRMGMRGGEFDSELELMRRKQGTHVKKQNNYVLGSDRSHANLRRLDDMVNRLELNRKKG